MTENCNGGLPAWEDFSAFDCAFEIDSFMDSLADWCEAYPDSQEPAEYRIGEKSFLIRRLNLQATEMERVLEREKPGLYRRTWYPGFFDQMFVRLDELVESPDNLKAELPWIKESALKTLIIAQEFFNPAYLAKVVKETRTEAVGNAIRNNNKNAAQKSRASKGITLAIQHLLKIAQSNSEKTAEQIWRALKRYDESAPLDCDDFSVFEVDGELKSIYRDTGKADGRAIKKNSFHRAFARAKK